MVAPSRYVVTLHLVAALGDFRTGGVTAENVIANYWSVGAALVIR